jgi:chemotaxis response regulator CheB
VGDASIVILPLSVYGRHMKRVLLIASSTLFGRGVENLLRQEPGLEVVGCEVDVSKVIERVRELKPDVVIIERNKTVNDAGNTLGSMLRVCKKLKVIEMDSEDDTISIYSGQQQVIKHVQDLVTVIEASTTSSG